MSVVTTLNFAGRTEAALDFYRDAVGAQTLFLMRFRDAPDRSLLRAGSEDQIFHATFTIAGTTFMASDVTPAGQAPPSFSGFALALRAASVEQARQMFGALCEGGTVVIPLSASTFTGWYGIVIDRFGISWKVTVE